MDRSLNCSHDSCEPTTNMIPSPAPECMYVNFSPVVTLDGVWYGHYCEEHEIHWPTAIYAQSVMNICGLPVSKLGDQLECPEYNEIIDGDETVLVTP